MEELDSKDRQLLYWLDRNSRATNKELAKKIWLSEQAIAYRTNRLEKQGVIKNYVTFVNTLCLGYQHYKVFLKLQNTTDKIESDLVHLLVMQKSIRWVVTTSGKYDVSFSVLAQTPLEFSQIYRSVESAFGDYITEKNVLINIESPSFTREWLISGKESKKFEYLQQSTQSIDDVDKKILQYIAINARASLLSIAKDTKLSIDIVNYRLKRLKEKQVINGFTLQLDLEKLGYEYYTIFLHTHKLDKMVEKKMITFATLHPNILYLVYVIGNHDLQLEMEVKNYAALEHNFKEFRREFSSIIREFEILRVTKEYKYNFYPFS